MERAEENRFQTRHIMIVSNKDQKVNAPMNLKVNYLSQSCKRISSDGYGNGQIHVHFLPWR